MLQILYIYKSWKCEQKLLNIIQIANQLLNKNQEFSLSILQFCFFDFISKYRRQMCHFLDVVQESHDQYKDEN